MITQVIINEGDSREQILSVLNSLTDYLYNKGYVLIELQSKPKGRDVFKAIPKHGIRNLNGSIIWTWDIFKNQFWKSFDFSKLNLIAIEILPLPNNEYMVEIGSI